MIDRAGVVQFGRFVAAVYDMDLAAGSVDLRPPVTDSFPSDYELRGWITMSDFAGAFTQRVFYGIVARSRATPSEMVIAIRGTLRWLEWFDDIHAGFMTCQAATGTVAGDVHAGFGMIYKTLEFTAIDEPSTRLDLLGGRFAEQIAAQIERDMGATDVRAAPSIVVVGHSLGAALATLYVVRNGSLRPSRRPEVVTFASPRVGDATFVKAYEAQGLNTHRIVNEPDLAPKLPWPALGYVHVNDATPDLIDSTGLVRSTLSCAHALNSYLYTLDRSIALDAACKSAPGDWHQTDSNDERHDPQASGEAECYE